MHLKLGTLHNIDKSALNNHHKMPQTKKNHRYQLLDFIRGIAIVLMFLFHLSFGLAQLGLLNIQFSTDPLWIGFRAVIVFLFLSLVGMGLFLATRNQLNLSSYIKRLLLLAVYFSLITLLSQQVRPDFYVFFGILHLIFVSSLLGLLLIRFYWFNLVLGLAFILLGNFYQFAFFNQPLLLWVGMNQVNLMADDYAPLFPWFGLVLIGMFLAKFLFAKHQFARLYHWQATNGLSKLITWAGRYSIHIYFVHFQLFYVLVYFFG